MEEDNVVRVIQLFKWTAEYCYEQGSMIKVLDYLQIAKKIIQERYGDLSAESLEADYELTAVFSDLGHQVDGALEILEAGRIEFKIDTSKPSSNACFGILAQANLLMGKKTEALKLFKLAVAQRSELVGPKAPFTLVAKYRLLKASVEKNKAGAYTSELQEMYGELSALLGRNHLVVEDLMKTLAVDLHKQGRKKESLKLFKNQASLDYPKMDDKMAAFTAYILMSAALAWKGLKMESLESMEAGFYASQEFGDSENPNIALAQLLFAGLLEQLGLDIYVPDGLQLPKNEHCAPPDLIDVHRRMNNWFRDVYTKEAKPVHEDAKKIVQDTTNTRIATETCRNAFEIKYNEAKKLMEDYKYNEAFRSLMKLYDEQAEVLGYADETAVKTLKTLDCWELRPEFVSHPVLVEAYKFLERVLPKVQSASTQRTSKDWMYDLQWRQGFLMTKAQDCSPEKANQVCEDALKQAASNFKSVKYQLSIWETADRANCLLIFSTFTPLIEELLQGREKILYQSLVQLDKAKSGCIRGGLRALLSLYQKVVNELEMHDPLLVSLLESIYEVYEMIPDRKSLGEQVNFFKSKLQHFKHKLGPEHPSTLIVQEIFCCSLVRWTTERPDLKKELRLRAVIEETAEKTSRVLGDKHLVSIKAKQNLSAVIMGDVFGCGTFPRPGMLHKFRELEELVNNTFDTYAEIYGKEHPRYWNQCLVLSNLYSGPLLKPDRALKLAEEAYAGLTKRYGKESEHAAAAKNLISKAQSNKGRVLDLSGMRFV